MGILWTLVWYCNTVRLTSRLFWEWTALHSFGMNTVQILQYCTIMNVPKIRSEFWFRQVTTQGRELHRAREHNLPEACQGRPSSLENEWEGQGEGEKPYQWGHAHVPKNCWTHQGKTNCLAQGGWWFSNCPSLMRRKHGRRLNYGRSSKGSHQQGQWWGLAWTAWRGLVIWSQVSQVTRSYI
jgi:hypothetical protein